MTSFGSLLSLTHYMSLSYVIWSLLNPLSYHNGIKISQNE